jgi:NADH-quinone oxidoreductase subunit L
MEHGGSAATCRGPPRSGLATLAIAGIPPLSGFFSKDEILAFAWGRGEHEAVWKVFWAMGALGALLTAFYMARLLAMTFLGENRTGAKEREHLHEAPWIMTGPLLVLGVLTVVGGAINFPGFWPTGPHHLLDRWLEPVVDGSRVPQGRAAARTDRAGADRTGGGNRGSRTDLGRSRPCAGRSLPPQRARRVGPLEGDNRKWYVDARLRRVVVRPLTGSAATVLEDRRSENHRRGRDQQPAWLSRARQAGQPAPDR